MAQMTMPSMMRSQKPQGTMNEGAALRQKLMGSATMMPAMSNTAGAALEQLKRTADKMVEEQESTRHNTELQKEKLQAAQSTNTRLEAELTKERQANAQLRARIKDDERQVQYVMDKMKLVTSLHDGLRGSISQLSVDVTDLDKCRLSIAQKANAQEIMCEDFHLKFEHMSDTKKDLETKLKLAVQENANLQQQLLELRTNLAGRNSELAQKAAEMAELQKQAELKIFELSTQLQSVSNQLAATTSEMNRKDQIYAEHKSSWLAESEAINIKIQGLEQSNGQLADELKLAFSKHESDDEELRRYSERYSAMEKNLSRAEHALLKGAADLEDRNQQLEQTKEDNAKMSGEITSLTTQLQEATLQLVELQVEKAAVDAELQQAVAAQAKAQSDYMEKLQQLADEKQAIEEKQAEACTMVEALTLEVQETRKKAKEQETELEAKVREAQKAAEVKIQRFAERTAKELEDFRKKAKADADTVSNKLSDDVKAAITAKDELATQLEAEVAARKALEQRLEEVLKQHAAEMDTLKSTSGNDQVRYAEQLAALAKAHGEELAAATVTAEAALKQAQAKLQEEHKKAETEWNKQKELAQQQLANTLKEHETKVAALNTALNALEGQKEELAVQLRSKSQELSSKQAEHHARVKELEAQSASYVAQLQDANEKLELFKADLVEFEAKAQLAQVEMDKKDILLKQISDRIQSAALGTAQTIQAAKTPARDMPPPKAQPAPSTQPRTAPIRTIAAAPPSPKVAPAPSAKMNKKRQTWTDQDTQDTDKLDGDGSDAETADTRAVSKGRAGHAAPAAKRSKPAAAVPGKIQVMPPPQATARKSRISVMASQSVQEMSEADYDAVSGGTRGGHGRNASRKSGAAEVSSQPSCRANDGHRKKGASAKDTHKAEQLKNDYASAAMDIFGSASMMNPYSFDDLSL